MSPALGSLPSRWRDARQGSFGHTGGFGYQEDATGLKLLGHRYYDGSTGRFLTRDPIKDGRNWYAYCGNDPLAFFDSAGERAVWLSFGVGGIIPFGSGMATISIGLDIDSGHFGIQGEVGGGVGMGIAGGISGTVGYDDSSTINGNGAGGWGKGNTGYALGVTILAAEAEMTMGDDFNPNGGGVGGGLPPHGPGAGVFFEKRASLTYDLSQPVIDAWDGFKDWCRDNVFPTWPTSPLYPRL